MHVVVATHGHCFDGLASAALFTRLFQEVEGRSATFSYRACGYGPGQLGATDAVLTGDVNAILDYRFSPSERLGWYFDHHATAFARPEDRAFFEARRTERRFFYDPALTSCTKLIAEVATAHFGVQMNDRAELVRWADVIDSASFRTPEEALDRSNPVLRLAAVVERHADDKLLSRLVPALTKETLQEVAESKDVTTRYAKIAPQHETFVRRVRERSERVGRVVYVDLTDEPLQTIGKFVTYALHPDAVYSVIVGAMKQAVKISVGYNPWCGKPCGVDLSAICARFGGGGHRYVGAVQFPAKELARAREVARGIAEELAG